MNLCTFCFPADLSFFRKIIIFSDLPLSQYRFLPRHQERDQTLCYPGFVIFLLGNKNVLIIRCKMDSTLLATFEEVEALEKIPSGKTKEYQKVGIFLSTLRLPVTF